MYVGHIDIWFPAEGRIIEVKSVSDRDQDLPRRDHVLQVQAYMHYLRDARGERRCDVAEIVYVKYGRELQYQVFVVEYDEVVARDIDDQLRHLHEYAERYELPDIHKGYEPTSSPCITFYGGEPRRCPMWDKCWVGNPEMPALDAPEVADWDLQKVGRFLREFQPNPLLLKAEERLLVSSGPLVIKDGRTLEEAVWAHQRGFLVIVLTAAQDVRELRVLRRDGELPDARTFDDETERAWRDARGEVIDTTYLGIQKMCETVWRCVEHASETEPAAAFGNC
jgi:hypothetical protein